MSDQPIDWAARRERARAYLTRRTVVQVAYYEDGKMKARWEETSTYAYDKEQDDVPEIENRTAAHST